MTTPTESDIRPNQMQLLLIGLWAIKGKAPTKAEMVEFYQALVDVGKQPESIRAGKDG